MPLAVQCDILEDLQALWVRKLLICYCVAVICGDAFTHGFLDTRL